jgi:hypothetical protein
LRIIPPTILRLRGNVFNELLPSNDREIHRDTQRRWEGFMKYAVEMGSGTMLHIPSFIKIGSVIQKLMEGGELTDTQTHSQYGDLISILLFFRNKESRLKVIYKIVMMCVFSIPKIGELTSTGLMSASVTTTLLSRRG